MKKHNEMVWIRGHGLCRDLLVLCCTRKRYDEITKVLCPGDEPSDLELSGECSTFIDVAGYKFIVVWVESRNLYSYDWYGTLAHEISHAVDKQFQFVEINGSVEHTEHRAMLMGRWMTTALAGLRGGREATAKEQWTALFKQLRSIGCVKVST